MRTNSNALSKTFLIIAMVACYAMIFIDESGIAVTLSSIQQNFALTSNAIHWIVNGYLLTLSVLLLLGGKLSDIIGPRKIFTMGITIFLIASLVCASAQNGWMLNGGRVLQGVGASFLMPCIAVLINMKFPENEFGKAFGIILGFSNLFYALGPFIGGLITEFVNWRWFFLVNIPIGLICLCGTFLAIKEDRVDSNVKFTDIKGLIIFIVSLSALVIALMQGASWGWNSISTIGLFVIAIVGLLLFVKIELNVKEPLLDMRLFLNKAFLAGNTVMFCASICLTSIVFWALWLQTSVGFSPATVGAALLPATFTFIFMPTISGAWRDKSGSRSPMLLGTLLILLGVLWIAVTASSQSYLWLFFGMLAFGFGIPLAIPNSYMTAVTSVKAEQSGVASGTCTTMRQLGLSMGIAIMSAVVTSINEKHVSQLLTTSADYVDITSHQVSLLLAGKNTILQLNTDKLIELKQAAAMIYTHAFACGMAVISVFAIISCIFTFVFIPKQQK